MNSKQLNELQLVNAGLSELSTGSDSVNSEYKTRSATVGQDAAAVSENEPEKSSGIDSAAVTAFEETVAFAAAPAAAGGDVFNLELDSIGDIETVLDSDVTGTFTGGVFFGTSADEEMPVVDGSVKVTGGGTEGSPISVTNDFTGGNVVNYNDSIIYTDTNPLRVTGDIVVDLSDVNYTGGYGLVVMGGKVSGTGGDGMVIEGKVDVSLTRVTVGSNALVLGVYADNGGKISVGKGIFAVLDNVSSSDAIYGSLVGSNAAEVNIAGGIAISVRNSTVRNILGTGNNTDGGSGSSIHVSKNADTGFAIDISVENTTFSYVSGSTVSGTVEGIRITIDRDSRGDTVAGAGHGYNGKQSGDIVVDGDIDISLYDNSCHYVYGAYGASYSETESIFVEKDIRITIRSGGGTAEDGGILHVRGGITGTYDWDPEAGESIPSAEVKGKISIRVEGHNIGSYMGGSNHSVGANLTGGNAIETIITGDLTVHEYFLGGTEAGELPVIINGDISVKVAEDTEPTLVFLGSFVGGFQGRGITINGKIDIDLKNAEFRKDFTGGGIISWGYGEGGVSVKQGINVTLKDSSFVSDQYALRQVIGIRQISGDFEVDGGVTGTFSNVRFVDDFDTEEHPRGEEHTLYGGAYVEGGKGTIRGGVDLSFTGCGFESVYCGGYAKEEFYYQPPVDNDGSTDPDDFKRALVIYANAEGIAVKGFFDSTSFTSVQGTGRNIEVNGNVELTIQNGTSGELLYGSGSDVWLNGDISVTVTGNSSIGKLVGGGSGTKEIREEIWNEETQEYEWVSYGYLGYIDGNIRITLSGGSTFDTVYGGSDYLGGPTGANDPVPTRRKASSFSSSDPGSQMSEPGRPTEIYKAINVILKNVTIKNYVGAGLGSVGRDLAAGSTAVETEFTTGTTITESFVGGSYYAHYLQDNPVIYGDVKVSGGGGAEQITISGEFVAGSKVVFTETEVVYGYWDQHYVSDPDVEGYEYVGSGGDYTEIYGMYLPNPHGNYRYDPETDSYIEVGENEGEFSYYHFAYYEYTPGAGNYNKVQGGYNYVEVWVPPETEKTDSHIIKGSVIADLKKVVFTGAGKLQSGGGYVEGADPDGVKLMYTVEKDVSISFTDTAFGSHSFVSGLQVVKGGYGVVKGEVRTNLKNVTFSASSLSTPSLVLGGYASDNGRAELRGGVESTLENVNMSARAGSTVYGGGYAVTGGNADITGSVVLNIKSGSYGTVYGGGGVSGTGSADVSGDVTLNITGGTFTGLIVGGGDNADVGGSIKLTLGGVFRNDVYGGGYGGDVAGSIDISITTAACGTSGRFVYGGGSGNVGASLAGGTAVRLTVNSASYQELYHIFLGTYSNSTFSGNYTIKGDVELILTSTGVSASNQYTGMVHGGSYRNGVAGTSAITGMAKLNFRATMFTNAVYGGGYASSTGNQVKTVTEGGVSINYAGTTVTGVTYAGGRAKGANAVDQIGTETNRAGTSVTVGEGSDVKNIFGGGLAQNSGLSIIYGDAVINVNGGGTNLIQAGGYGNGGNAIVYGKGIVRINGCSTSDYIYGGGYATANGRSAVTEGTEITISSHAKDDVIVFGGGRNSGSGISYVGADLDGNITADGTGSNITLNADTTLRRIYGGGYSGGTGKSIVYGGSHITINDGNLTEGVFGGGYTEPSGTAIVYGGSYINISGGNVRNVYGGGSTQEACVGENHSVVEGGSRIVIGSSSKTITVGNVYGGGSFAAVVKGGSLIEFTGDGSKLNFTGVAMGTNADGSGVYGIKELKFNGFTGSISGTFKEFDSITVGGGSAVTWDAVQNNLASVSNWTFGLENGKTALTWGDGLNDFIGDSMNLNFGDGYSGGTVINGGNASIFSGWDQLGSVKFNGELATWSNSGYETENWRLSLDSSNNLILSKLA